MALNSSAAQLEKVNESDQSKKGRSTREDTLLTKYMRDMARYPILKKEEEAELGQYINFYGSQIEELEQDLDEKPLSPEEVAEIKTRIRELDAEMKPYMHEFMVHNLRLVVSVAKRYQGRGLKLMDLIQEGNIGLERAAFKFDISRGYRFSTYAVWWIRQSITRGISDRGRDIRFPVYIQDKIDKIRHYMKEHHNTYGCDPSIEEICAHFNISPKKASKLLLLADVKYLSIDTPINGEDGGSSFANLLFDHDAVTADLAAINKETERDVERLLKARLNPREERIIRLRFGLDPACKEELTLKEIGVIFGVTRERIRQLEAQAMGKLRKACRDKDD